MKRIELIIIKREFFRPQVRCAVTARTLKD